MTTCSIAPDEPPAQARCDVASAHDRGDEPQVLERLLGGVGDGRVLLHHVREVQKLEVHALLMRVETGLLATGGAQEGVTPAKLGGARATVDAQHRSAMVRG